MKTKKRRYEKPTIRKAKGVSFVMVAIRAGWVTTCRYCSSCHGCR